MILPQSQIKVPMPPVKPPAAPVRIQYRDADEGPGIDEAVVRGVESVHIEALDENLLWIGITRPNAERIVFTVTRARGYLRVTQTEGADDGKASNSRLDGIIPHNKVLGGENQGGAA